MTDIEAAKLDPAHYYKSPREVIGDESLSRKDKIDILRRWAYDEREIAVAEEENMLSHDNKHGVILDEILQALLQLGVRSDESEHPPTKQG